MRISVLGSKPMGWRLVLDGLEEVGVVENATFEEALEAMAANWPEYGKELDQLRCDEFIGTQKLPDRRRGTRVERKRGSGARFRELILQGKSNEECVKIVREEFVESKATLSDAAWQRAQLRKNPDGFREDGSKKGV